MVGATFANATAGTDMQNERATSHDTRRWEWLFEANAFLGSMASHLVVLIVLGLLSALVVDSPIKKGELAIQLGSGPGSLGGEAGRRAGASELDHDLDDAVAELQSPPSNDVASTSSNASALKPLDDAATRIHEARFFDALNADPLGQSSSPSRTGAASSRLGLGGSGLGEIGDGTGGGGDSFGVGNGFFGIGNTGKSIVYVVDSSGSMIDESKWDLARKELLRSLNNLADNQRFFIILYSDGAYPMDADEPLLASSDNISQVMHWLYQISPAGGTQPLQALLYALSLKPDEIYFLSDGMFDVTVIQQLKTANSGRKPIPIHTIAFRNQQTVGLMRILARHSGGKFRFVN